MTRLITFIIILLLIVLTSLSCSSAKKQLETKGSTITVTVPNIRTNKGIVYFTLYNSQESFINKVPYQSKSVEVENNSVEIEFSEIPKGTYAILCYHDINNNQKLDFTGFIPSEPYGMSNNPQLMGPPRFEQLKFDVSETKLTFEIRF